MARVTKFTVSRWFGQLLVMALAGIMTLSPAPIRQSSAVADDGSWNPFADKDRAAARRAARKRRQQPPTGTNPRGPYLAPITKFDGANTGRARQPYSPTQPGTAPGNAPGTPYAPPGQTGVGQTNPGQPGIPYGAPGTYSAPPAVSRGTLGASNTRVDRGELTPVISSDGALPAGIWQGLDASAAERLLGPVALPPASPALNDLLNRIMAEPVADLRLNAVRLAALLKAGRFDTAAQLRDKTPTETPADPIQDVIQARLDMATANTDQGCIRIKRAVGAQNKLPKRLRGEAIVTAGYCAIVAGNAQAGGLAAELARDAGYKQPFTLAILEAITNGENVRSPLPNRVSLLDGLLIRQLKTPDPALIESMVTANASPGFIQLIAADKNLPPALRLRAAERAAGTNIVAPAALADIYRTAADNPGGSGAPEDRARQFATSERNQAQFSKTRAIRALLDSARRDGLYHPVAVAIAPIVRSMRPAQEISWFNETAVETLAAGGDYQTAREWVRATPPSGQQARSLDHWLMLLDIADPEVNDQNRGRSIVVLENLALQGRFSGPALHRLATVLDALDYNVPIPLWNLASRTEQPQTGHLPETGFLSAMKQASEARQIAATTLYALRTIAPTGTTATHLLGLGETIRALKRAGLERNARRLGFEALFGDWPRTSG